MINEYILKISSEKINIGQSLKRGCQYNIMGSIEVREVGEKENDTENPDAIYKARWLPPIQIIDEKGQIVQVKDKRSASSRLKGAFWLLGQDLGVEDDELFYQMNMKKIISYLPEIVKFLNTKT